MKTNKYILLILSLIFMISCKDDDPVTTDPTDPVTGGSDVFYQLPDMNTGAITFEEVDGVVYGPFALADGTLNPAYEKNADNELGSWGVFGEVKDTDGNVTGEKPDFLYVDNPDKATGNDSDRVLKVTKNKGAETWSGVYFDFEKALDFTTAAKGAISIDFWSPIDGLEVKIKLETTKLDPNTNTGEIISSVVNGVVANSWNKLTFNIPADKASDDYQRFVLIPSGKVSTSEASTYYFDNIEFADTVEPEPVNVTFDLTFAAMGGATVVDDVYTFATGNEAWAGFANDNTDFYPLTLSSDMEIQFTGSAPAGSSTEVKFRFEYKPNPNVEPSYNTASVNVNSATETTYSISVPNQGGKTFESIIMYVVENDVPVTLKDIKIAHPTTVE